MMEQFRSNWPQPEDNPWQNHGQFEHASNPEQKSEKIKNREEEIAKKKREAEENQKAKKTKEEKTAEQDRKKAEKGKGKAEKTKEEKREELVEKSRELTQKYEDEPIPRDPAIVAQLLIAGHILSLNNQVEAPRSPKEVLEREALLASIDYMGALAQKLQDPSKETDPDIEAASALLLNLAEAALADTEPEALIQQNKAVTREYLEIIAESDETGAALEIELHNRAKTPIPPLVQHLFTLRRNAAILPESTPPASGPDGGAAKPVTTSVRKEAAAKSKKPAASTLETRPAPQPPTSSLTPLAATAAIVASLHREKSAPESKETTETTEASPTRDDILRAALPLESAPDRFDAPEILPPRTTVGSPAEVTLFPATPDQPRLIFPETSSGFQDYNPSLAEQAPIHEPTKPKLEHLPLTTLLTMAETVSVGYGRYLRREFEAGHIDKEGLIKVLKSRAKGKDFLVEFQNQAVRFQTLKATSPEFLTPTTPPTAPPLPSEPLTSTLAPPDPQSMQASRSTNLPKPVPQTTESKVAKEQPSTDLQQKLDQISNKTWVAAIALASVILLLLVLSLMR